MAMKSSTRSSVARVGITPVAAFTAFSLLSTAHAGPSWDRDHLEDAGQTAATAQVITSSLSPIIVVSGRLTGSGLVQSDFVDMYQVQITGQTWVSISTAGGVLGGGADFDTQLFLFRRKGGNGNNARAVALKGNNDAAPDNHGSRLGEGPGPGSNAVLLSPGFYYIAVAGVGTDAFADTGAVIWPDLGDPGQTVNGNEFLLHGWGGSGEVGEYSIRLQVASGGAVPTPSALALIGLGALLSRRRRA
jgi:MYXO-CTERM domain-containing protein